MDIGREKLINLMNRMRSQVPPEAPAPDCTDVSWTVPHHFDTHAAERIAGLANALAEYMQKTLRVLCDDTFELKFKAVTEHYASFLAEQIEQDNSSHYFIPLSMQGKGPVGFIAFPFESCTGLISQMLRDPESGIGDESQLSALEESILQDIVNMIADSLREGFSAHGAIVLEKAEQIVRGQWSLPVRKLEDMCQMSFQAGNDEMQFEISLYVLDAVIDSIAGVPSVQSTPEQLKKIPEKITECAGNVAVEASVWLSPSMMAFQDIVTLEKGDFVLLDHNVNTPLDVQIDGKEYFKAWPAQSAGRGAIVLTGQSTNS